VGVPPKGGGATTKKSFFPAAYRRGKVEGRGVSLGREGVVDPLSVGGPGAHSNPGPSAFPQHTAGERSGDPEGPRAGRGS
jgi:hypothetical protein